MKYNIIENKINLFRLKMKMKQLKVKQLETLSYLLN